MATITDKNTIMGLQALADHYSRQGLGKTKLWRLLGRELANAVGRHQAWGRAYVQQVHDGKKAPGPDFARAVQTLGALIDGLPAHLGPLESVPVYAAPGTVLPGSLVLGPAVKCKKEGCNNWFVNNNPLRLYCFICSPPGRFTK